MYRYNMQNTMDMSKQHMSPIELYEIAVFIRGQVPETQQQLRELHGKNERQALFLVRNAMEKMGYFK